MCVCVFDKNWILNFESWTEEYFFEKILYSRPFSCFLNILHRIFCILALKVVWCQQIINPFKRIVCGPIWFAFDVAVIIYNWIICFHSDWFFVFFSFISGMRNNRPFIYLFSLARSFSGISYSFEIEPKTTNWWCDCRMFTEHPWVSNFNSGFNWSWSRCNNDKPYIYGWWVVSTLSSLK